MSTTTADPQAPAETADLTPLPAHIVERRERVFLALAGLFLCAMTMLNIIGITKFVQLGPMALAVGVLPYPITFLCTDLISELYGRARANFLVTVGLVLNFFILGVMWLGNMMPAAEQIPPWQLLSSLRMLDYLMAAVSAARLSCSASCTRLHPVPCSPQ